MTSIYKPFTTSQGSIEAMHWNYLENTSILTFLVPWYELVSVSFHWIGLISNFQIRMFNFYLVFGLNGHWKCNNEKDFNPNLRPHVNTKWYDFRQSVDSKSDLWHSKVDVWPSNIPCPILLYYLRWELGRTQAWCWEHPHSWLRIQDISTDEVSAKSFQGIPDATVGQNRICPFTPFSLFPSIILSNFTSLHNNK